MGVCERTGCDGKMSRAREPLGPVPAGRKCRSRLAVAGEAVALVLARWPVPPAAEPADPWWEPDRVPGGQSHRSASN